VNEREYLVKALEAEALADAATNWLKRRHWEKIAKKHRRMAESLAVERRLASFGVGAQEATEREVGDVADKITRAPKKRG
jgi:hypothetical protein